MSDFLRSALAYAIRLHWPVFPLKPHAKDPITTHGFKDATLDEAQIREWWTKWPQANIGVPTGVWFWVLDEDPRHGGDESIRHLVYQHGALPTTVEQMSGGGGRHRCYALMDGIEIGCREKILPGLDVKGTGGYIVVAPSIHPETRKEYVWDGSEPLDKQAIVRAPDWLIDLVREPPNRANGEPFELPPKMKAKDKQRHPTLRKMAASMSAKGCGYGEILAAVWAVNQERCEPPYDRKHIEDLARYYADKDRMRNEPPPEEKRALVLPVPDTVDEILDADIRLPEPLVEDLFPRRGLVLMTGAQRSGKTIFAAQLAIALATKHPLLNNYRLCAHGPVIVFEKDDPDGKASFKDIYLKAKVPRGTPIDYYGKEKIPIPLGQGFLEWLETIIPKTGAVLVVLDSYTALRPERKSGSDIVHIERQDIAGLDELAKKLNCLILLLHHESITTRANGSLEWDARGAGTYGMSMAAECQMAITRFRELPIDAPERLVRFRSRHMKEHQAVLFYSPKTGLYEHIFSGRHAHHYPLIRDIKRKIQNETFTAKHVEEALAVSRATAFRTLGTLRAADILWHVKNSGEYRFAPEIEAICIPPE